MTTKTKPTRTRLGITYHLIGLNCPELPRNLLGTQHGVTQFMDMCNCERCLVIWDEMLMKADPATPTLDENGAVVIPQMTLKVVAR